MLLSFLKVKIAAKVQLYFEICKFIRLKSAKINKFSLFWPIIYQKLARIGYKILHLAEKEVNHSMSKLLRKTRWRN